MEIESTIAWYGSNRFNAEDMQRATGLSERSQRELLKLGVLQAIPQSRTAARMFDSRMLKRAALVYPLYAHGSFNLQVSGKLVYADLILEDLLFSVIDPWQAQYRHAERVPGSEREWGWFTSKEPPAAEPNDYYITLINRHYVASGPADSPRVYGYLTEDHSDVVVYQGAVYDELLNPSGKIPEWSQGPFHPRSALRGKSRKFKSTRASKSEQDAAKRALRSPISKFSVNASLTLRIAMRRLLQIDGDES